MKELIKYLVIRITTRHAKTAADIYQTLYPVKEKEIVYVARIINTTTSENVSVSSVANTNSKKNEVLNSLEYLKNKPVKTKQDKDSIYSLEMVLKNMK
jgi:hypothetical protein